MTAVLLVSAQALDNVSEDVAVSTSATGAATDVRFSREFRLVSETMQRGATSEHHGVSFTETWAYVVIKVPTADVDTAGRRAPVLALVDVPARADSRWRDDVAAEIERRALLLERRPQTELLVEALGLWSPGKAFRGFRWLLSKLRRWLQSLALFARSRGG